METPIRDLLSTVEQYRRFYNEDEPEAMKHIRADLRRIREMGLDQIVALAAQTPNEPIQVGIAGRPIPGAHSEANHV